jgi:SHS2 domain-containing protein
MPTDDPSDRDQWSAEEAFEEVDHTADWALRVRGGNLAGLFVNAARGMASLLVADLKQIPTDVERTLALESLDAESLLVDWLSEFAYWAETEQLIFRQVEIQEIRATALRAVVRGGRAPELQKHIKAVTYHNLEINQRADGQLEATIVFDV